MRKIRCKTYLLSTLQDVSSQHVARRIFSAPTDASPSSRRTCLRSKRSISPNDMLLFLFPLFIFSSRCTYRHSGSKHQHCHACRQGSVSSLRRPHILCIHDSGFCGRIHSGFTYSAMNPGTCPRGIPSA